MLQTIFIYIEKKYIYIYIYIYIYYHILGNRWLWYYIIISLRKVVTIVYNISIIYINSSIRGALAG